MNEVLDIMFYIIKPLQKLLPDLNSIGKSNIKHDSSNIKLVVVGRERRRERARERLPGDYVFDTISGSSSASGDTEEVDRTEVPKRYSELVHWDGMKDRLGIGAEPIEGSDVDRLRRLQRRAQRRAQKSKQGISVLASSEPLNYPNRVFGKDSEGNVIESFGF